jgi:DNA-binding response OmpR family regulator
LHAEEIMTTVLLVEDRTDLADIITQELQAASYQVLYAPDGLTALDLHATHQPDLVILDWMLPRLDGLEVLRRLRKSSPVPVLMLTARSEEVDRVIGLEVGADDYLTKPFSMRELVARVRALLRRAERMQQIWQSDRTIEGAPIERGPLVLDPAGHKATLYGKALDLSPIEFALLHLLICNPGRAFSRTYLLETIWDEYYVAGDRSVDNAISRLRRKLGNLGRDVETVWGVGYRWRLE